MIPRRIRLPYLTTVLTTIAIGACSGSLSNSSPLADSKLAGDVGVTARDEVESALNSLTLPSTLGPVGTAQTNPGASPSCVTPSTVTDSDGDGIPDDAIYVFTAPPCRFTGWRGGTLELVGQLRIQDPAPAAAGFGYEATLTGLRTRFTSSDKKLTDVTRNGTRTLSGSVSSLLLAADLQVVRNFAGKPDAAIDQQWTLTYTPAGSLQINAPLPSGELEIVGNMNWARGTEDFSLTVTTPTVLHYNATCTDTVQRIDAGELNLAGTIDGVAGFVRVRWTACGKDPSYTFIASQ